MHVSSRHILRQGPALTALGRTALIALARGLRTRDGTAPPTNAGLAPGPEHTRECAPLPRALIDDYLELLGGDGRAYRGVIPAHLFPQWTMPLLARTLAPLPYPLLRVVNGGCRVEVRATLPDDEPLQVRAQLLSIDDDGRRAVLKQRAVTGTRSAPDALVIDFFAIVPLRTSRAEPGTSARPSERQPVRVPRGARELAVYDLSAADALGYAKLTGDFNPIHWLPPYARASGFGSVILHGFASLGLAWEGLVKARFGGDVAALRFIDVKLTKPLVLPHRVGLYCDGDELFLGNGPDGPAYLTGRFG